MDVQSLHLRNQGRSLQAKDFGRAAFSGDAATDPLQDGRDVPVLHILKVMSSACSRRSKFGYANDQGSEDNLQVGFSFSTLGALTCSGRVDQEGS